MKAINTPPAWVWMRCGPDREKEEAAGGQTGVTACPLFYGKAEDLTKAETTSSSKLTHTCAPPPHFPGKDNQIGDVSREGQATKVSLVFLPNKHRQGEERDRT